MEQKMITRTVQTITHSFLIVLLAVACSSQKEVPAAEAELAKGQLSQQNVDATVWYHTSAENYYLYQQTYYYATMQLMKKLAEPADDNRPAAVVLDLDETVLDNSPYMLQLIQQNQTFSEETWARWVQQASANLLPGVKEFLEICEQNGVVVFYISNRSIKHLDATMNNLAKYQLPNATPDQILLKENTSDKTDRRSRAMSEFRVLLFLGDNLRDFDEMYADRSRSYGKEIVKAELQRMLPQYIIFPNPMYGQWQQIFSFPEGATEAERAKAKIQQAQPLDY
jgi:5'-nucleotidase (lipoprotein e(P4) family)